ncbi:MAG: hypothetical protein VW169_08630 [Rhodospirillaceae bacterium]
MTDTAEQTADTPEAESNFETGVVSESGFRRRRWYHRQDVRFIGVVAAFVVAFQLYGYLTGPSRISSDLSRLMEQQEKIDIKVTAKFKAEAFHMEIYQDVGAIRGEDGDAVIVSGVRPSDIRFLARKYWIKSIELAPSRR